MQYPLDVRIQNFDMSNDNTKTGTGIVLYQIQCTLNSRRVASPLVILVEEEERCEAPEQPQGFLPQNWGETELNSSVTCMVLKVMASPLP
ncbi:hypothetical protein TNCV_4952571 [Trichonephila clavipes]|nr:hypothetical protein TNCV_4952571 [Trichonephila clavipes]